MCIIQWLFAKDGGEDEYEEEEVEEKKKKEKIVMSKVRNGAVQFVLIKISTVWW